MASTDRDALVAVYQATGGPNWCRRQNWNTENDISTWHGVKLNDEGRVVELSLTDNNLEGKLTSCARMP